MNKQLIEDSVIMYTNILIDLKYCLDTGIYCDEEHVKRSAFETKRKLESLKRKLD